MATQTELERKRAILTSALLQFSPDVQEIRNRSIQKIIIHIVAELENSVRQFVSPVEIRNSFLGDFGYSLSLIVIQETAEVLVREGIFERQKGRPVKYKLSEKSIQQYRGEVDAGDKLLLKVTKALFPDLDSNLEKIYADALISALCIIFAENQEIAINLMQGTTTDYLLRGDIISRVSADIYNNHQEIDIEQFKNKLKSFFSNTADPDFSKIKWNLAQYLHAAKALGINPDGSLLSTELFQNAIFYLDTNIIIPALEETHRHNKTFKAITQACTKISANFKIAEITVQELENWLDYQKEVVPKVFAKIPEGTLPKIRSLFIEKYVELESQGKSNIDIMELFEPFNDYRTKIKDVLLITIDDDDWFEENIGKPQVNSLANIIATRYFERRGRKKYFGQSVHDAAILLYLNKLNQNNPRKNFYITLDLSLAEGNFPNVSNIPITSLDGILTWLAPLTVGNDGSFQSLFSQMIKQKILPNEKFFDIGDFNIFTEIELNTKELPAEDVESCIRHLKASALNLNPTRAEDREKLFYSIRKYFADPGREYKKHLDALRLENFELKNLMDAQDRAHKESLKNKEGQLRELIAEGEKRLDSITAVRNQLKNEFDEFKIKVVAAIRFAMSVILLIASEIIMLILANKFGEGGNLWQKCINSWEIFALVFVLSGITGYFLVGRKRINALGIEIKNVFKN